MTTDYRPENILVTGGAGFIGSHFIRYMLNQHDDINIINLDSLTYAGSLDNLRDLSRANQHHFIQGDICDIDLIHHLFNEYPIDTVVNFAAESHVDRSIIGPGAFVFTNVIGTFNLLEAARLHWLEEKKLDEKKCRFHHISTDEVYGALSKTEKPFTENSPFKPNSPYSATKASSDHLVHCYHHTYGLPTTVSNCSNNYGPMQHAEKFIPTIIRSCLSWENIPLYGKGDQIRDWLYVEDHCRAIELILKHGKLGETYNIGGNNELINLDVAKQVCRILDQLLPQTEPYESLITFVPDRPGHDWRYAIDTTKIQNELGWEALEPFDRGLFKTIQACL
jgi:dTDP-glucose 4,6-dehydratase